MCPAHSEAPPSASVPRWERMLCLRMAPTYVTRKSHQMLGFLSRNLRHCPSSIKERTYKALVRPKVEYCASVWDPPTKNLRDKVETVQRKAARFVSNKPVYKDPKASVTKMIHDLQWESLDTRRKQAGLTMMYKIINNSVAIPILYHPPKATIINTRHSHNISSYCHTSLHRFSISTHSSRDSSQYGTLCQALSQRHLTWTDSSPCSRESRCKSYIIIIITVQRLLLICYSSL